MTERTPAKDLGAVFDAHVKAEFVDMDVAASAFDPKRTYSLPDEHRLDSQNDLAPHVPRGHFIQGDCWLVQWERAANMWPQAAVVVPSEKLLNPWSH